MHDLKGSFVEKYFFKKLFLIGYWGLFVLLWGLSTVFPRFSIAKPLYIIVLFVILLVGFYIRKIVREFDPSLKKQVFGVSLIIVIIFGIMGTLGTYELFVKRREGYVLISVSNVLCCLLFFIQVKTLYNDLDLKIKKIYIKLKNALFNHRCFVLLCIITTFLSFDTCWNQIKWDGMIYYNHSMNADLYSISSLGIVGHLTQSYAFLVSVARLVLCGSNLTLLFINICLLLFSSFCFYKFLLEVLPGSNKVIYSLLTFVYVFSPFMLGMVNYYSPDYMFTCLLVPLMYYTYKEKWGIFYAVSILFVFTKEPAIFAYLGICLGLLILDFWSDKCFKRIFLSARYYYMLSIGILWGMLYLFLGSWVAGNTGSESFKPSSVYIFNKLKVMFVLNFNWFFVLLTVFGLFVTQKKLKKLLLPCLLGLLLFTGMSVSFVTMNHARYAAISTPILILCSVICWGDFLIRNKHIVILMIGSLVVSVSLLISCFYTFDPVSKTVFNTINVGSTDLITTGQEKVGDYIVYNKQALWLEEVIDKGIKVGLDKQAQIIFPNSSGSFYSFDGMIEYSGSNDLGIDVSEEYWDTKGQYRCGSQLHRKTMQKLNILRVDNLENLPSGKYCYIYQPTDDSGIYEEILLNADNVEDNTFSYRGWSAKAILFEIN